MSRWSKLLFRVRMLSKDLTFEELSKVLQHYGYTPRRPSGGSSHCSFRKAGKPTVTLPDHGAMRTVYIAMVKAIVEEEENDDAEK